MSSDDTGARPRDSRPRGRHAADKAAVGSTTVGTPDGLLPADLQDDDAGSDRGPRTGLRRALIGVGIIALVLVVLVGGGAWFLTERYAGNIDRVADVFDDLDENDRPAPATP